MEGDQHRVNRGLHLKHVEECYVFFEGKRVGVEIVAG
jgi:hypothetical protein